MGPAFAIMCMFAIWWMPIFWSWIGYRLGAAVGVFNSDNGDGFFGTPSDWSGRKFDQPPRSHHPRGAPLRRLHQTGVWVAERKNRIGLVGGLFQFKKIITDAWRWHQSGVYTEYCSSSFIVLEALGDLIIQIYPAWYLKYSLGTVAVLNTKFSFCKSTQIYIFGYAPQIWLK